MVDNAGWVGRLDDRVSVAESGVLPFMERAGTCEKPCECFLLIIDLLFTRIGDVDILATYHKTAEEFFWVRRMKGRCLDKSSSCAR